MEIQNSSVLEAKRAYETYWESYQNGDLETFASTLDDNFEMIGTSETEVCHTKADGIQFLKAQVDEIVGKVEMRNRQIEPVLLDPMVLINEICDIYVLTDGDWHFYATLRISTWLRATQEGWKVVQQHGSLPDMRVGEGETLAIEKISKENLELRDAVKRRTAELEAKNRELEVEAALERVRAKTMAMHSSEDVGKCVVKMFAELTALGVDERTRFGIGILNHDNENNQLWTARKDGEEVRMHIGNINMASHPLLKSARKAWKEQVPFHKYVLEWEDLQNYYQMLNNAPDYKIQIPIEKLPKKEIQHCFIFEHGFFYAFSPHEFQPELIQIFKRFSSLFEQTYRRYLDLVRAEGQAREAKIETALERVRARTMAMHHTEELKEVIQVVYDQLLGLDIHVDHAGFILDYKDKEHMHIWLADHQQGVPSEITIPYFDSPHWNSFLDAKARQASFFANLLPFEVKNKFYRDIFEWIPELTEEAKQAILSKPALAISTVLLDNVGLYIEHYSETPFTAEENTVLMRFGIVFQQTYTRFLDLQKAEAQAREVQIQLALERVRARTMAMQKSEDLADVSYLLNKQVVELGIPTRGCAFNIYGEQDATEWFSSLEGTIPTYKTPRENIFLKYYEAGQRGETLWIEAFGGERIKQHYKYLASLSTAVEEKTIADDVAEVPERQIDHVAYFKYGYLLFITLEEAPEAHDIFKRFAKEFEQTYTRFLDLQKAEAQAREAEIQLALERVRARTMAMHSSDELSETAAVLFEQLQILGTTPERINLGIFKEESGTIEWWITTQEGHQISNNFFTKFDDHFVFSNMLNAWKAKEESNVIILSGDAVTDWVRYITQQLGMPVNPDLTKEKRFFSSAFFSQGLIATTTSEPLSTGAIHLLERFADVFDQTYTRFLDLQKAEAQAREAQIEVALEKLRSASIAMHKSEELIQVVRVLDKAILGLGIETSGTQIITDFSNPEKGSNDWYAREGQDYLEKFHIPYIEHSVTKNLYDALAKGVDFYSDRYSKDEKIKYFKMLYEYSDFRTTPKERRDYIFNLPEWVRAVVLSKNSMLIFQRFDLKEYSKEEEEIFKRFGKVFEQAYTRFLDLQKAEAQALDAIKRASVDRVRAEIATMRTTSDLERIQPLIWNELKILGVPFIRCGVFIMDEAKQDVQVFLSTPDGRSIAAFHLPYQSTEQSMQIVAHWQQKKLFKDHMDEAAFAEYTKNLVQQGAVASDEKYVTENRPTDLYLHFLPFLQGMLYVGNIASLKDDELQLVQNLTDAFSTAYARYEDFNKLEAAKGAVESAMSELKATQSQLVQQEKLASLGQLTAGIAHEIRNPLNFVNNFSEVSLELIDESLEEMNREPEIRDETIVNENLAHIKSNIKKVLDHGTRANSIVNAMLMHSRQGTGKPEPTMLNDFIREYSNLAYHGMRAGNHPLDVTIIFDLDENVKDVPIIAEDFSRVVLNICNNAFDAMREKTKYEIRSTKYEVGEGGTENFLPKLSIQTRLEGGNVLIQFEDNGPGIPDAIKDKILQPFFTTKKGTEGTGLGLSISHDIVKAHGGELQVDTKEGMGTIFIIKLPAYIIQ